MHLHPTGRNLTGMNDSIPLLVFTDLDGTLLSHDGYDWSAASTAIERLKSIGAGVVMASSKTAPEINVLRQEIGLQDWPAVIENGAGILKPNSTAMPDARVYSELRTRLDNVPARLRTQFMGFGDMELTQICEITGLSKASASLAAQRAFSEPGIWSGNTQDLAEFHEILAVQGMFARQGGRFLTLSFGMTKADQMAQIIMQYAPRHTVALGDAPNDVEMLEAADVGIIIANPHRDPLPSLDGEKSGQIIRTAQQGPTGWNQAILTLLKRLNL